MQNALTFPPLTALKTPNDHVFNVVIAYEDFETGKHAKRTYDFLAEHLGEDCIFHQQMWKFDVLAVPKLRDMAAKDAGTADLIIVSAHGRGDLPSETKSWIEMALSEKMNAIAIVGLFDREEYTDNPARSYLASVAERAHIDFFSQPGLWPKAEGTTTDQSHWEQNTKTLSTLVGLAHQPTDKDVSHWGINE